MKERFTILMMVALAVGLSAPTAQADLELQLSEAGFSAVTIVDNGAGDLDSATGRLLVDQSYGTYSVNFQIGLSKPVIGGPTVAALDLTDVDIQSSGLLPLTVKLTDTDFTLPVSSALLTSAIGGLYVNTPGSVTLTQILDPDNSLFAATNPANDTSVVLGPFTTTPFAGAGSASASISPLFSLTEVAEITLPPGTTISFDASSVVPVPAALLLGLLGLGVAGLKLRKSV